MNPAWAIPTITVLLCAATAVYAKHVSRALYLDCHHCGHDLNGDKQSRAGHTNTSRHYRCSNCGTHNAFDATT